MIARLKLYENVVIGGYLFDLGVRMAKLRPDLPLVSVDLLQQTPSDRFLGDVLLANAAVCRLIEFKRVGRLTRKERRKLAVLQNAVINNNSEIDLTKLSREVHWYIAIDEPRVIGEPVVSRACPYLDFDEDPEFISIQDFASKAAQEACGREADAETRRIRDAYLKWVCKEFSSIEKKESEAKGAKGIRSSAAGAFMVAINEKAETYWLAVPSIEYAFMNKIELARALRLGVEPDTPKYEHKISRGYGMSL